MLNSHFARVKSVVVLCLFLLACLGASKRLKGPELEEMARENPGELLQAALTEFTNGKPAGAYRLLDALVKEQPELGIAVFYRGFALHSKTQKRGEDQYKKAFPRISADLVNGIKLQEKYEVAEQLDYLYYLRSLVYKDAGMFTEALHDCDKALDLNGEMEETQTSVSQFQLLSLRGMLFMGMEKFEECVEAYTEAIEEDDLNKQQGSAFEGRAVCLMRAERFDEALADVGKAKEFEGRYAEAIEKLILEEMEKENDDGEEIRPDEL